MKYKLTTFIFVTAVIAISIYAILRPSYDLGLFIDLDRAYAQARILLALAMLAYVLIPIVRLKITQAIILIGGGLLLAAGITSIFSPMLFGYLSRYTALGDVIMAIEGGTIGLLAGLQLETKKLHLRQRLLLTPQYFRGRLSSFKPSKLVSSQSRTVQPL